MTHTTTVEEIELDTDQALSGNRFDAACEACGTAARFHTTGDQKALGETLEAHCYHCNSGRFPGLGETHRFRVVALTPDPDTSPNDPSRPPVYRADELE